MSWRDRKPGTAPTSILYGAAITETGDDWWPHRLDPQPPPPPVTPTPERRFLERMRLIRQRDGILTSAPEAVVSPDDERLAGELTKRAMEALVVGDDRLELALRRAADLLLGRSS